MQESGRGQSAREPEGLGGRAIDRDSDRDRDIDRDRDSDRDRNRDINIKKVRESVVKKESYSIMRSFVHVC